MKTMSKLVSLVLIGLLIGCGGKDEKKKASFSYEKKATTTTQQAAPKKLKYLHQKKSILQIKA